LEFQEQAGRPDPQLMGFALAEKATVVAFFHGG